MKQAMLGIVLEKDDWDCLEAVKDGRELDTGGIVWKCLRKVGAVVQIPSLKKNWPFLCLKPRLTFIGEDMRLEQVNLHKTDLVKELLAFYMGKNTMERQTFIINNLVIEEDLVTEDFML